MKMNIFWNLWKQKFESILRLMMKDSISLFSFLWLLLDYLVVLEETLRNVSAQCIRVPRETFCDDQVTHGSYASELSSS